VTPILQAHNLCKSFGDIQAVRGVSFHIERGEVFSLLGPNGAGKTTTISLLSCLLSPTQGDATVDGHSITENPQAVKRAIGVVPQEIALYPAISARENLLFWGRMVGLGGIQLKERVEAVLQIADLAERARDRVETFSGGMKRRLNIAVGLLHQPAMLFLDEPTVGIDPQSRRRILDTIKELNRQGMTVLYTTHYMEEAEELSHRIGVMDHGQLIAVGNQSELTQMVGEHELVHLGVEFNGTDQGDLVQHLATLEGVRHASADDRSLLLEVSEADTVLADVVMVVAQAGAHVRHLEIREPNLEAVFLHLTGRGLRD
jgi:ABC-2 type transport system ATP-binding protein